MILPQIPKDKANHFIYGFVIFILSNLFFIDFISLAIVLFFAVSKEVHDKFSTLGTPDVYDILATVLPAIILTIV
jgi:hypothetical protein